MLRTFSRSYFLSWCLLMMVLTAHSQTSLISGTINIYTPVTAIDTISCPSVLTVSSAAGFSVGNKVLIIQMKGAAFDSSNASSFGTINAINEAGNYEIAQILAISGNSVTVNGRLISPYNIAGKVQMVRIPTYTNAQVTSVLTCDPWNGLTGGVLILEATGNLALSANIDVNGKGFRGGTISNNPDGSCGSGSTGYYYPLTQSGSSWSSGGAQKGEGIGEVSAAKQAGRGALVNGGGGGNKHNTGGGGGSNYTAGGQGGNELSGCTILSTGGRGGNTLASYYTNRLFLGGGGGSGDQNNGVGTAGERGGGIAIIIANSISGNGFLMTANGNTVTGVGGAAADGAGGGGGGGSIFVQVITIGSTFSAQANGGTGGNQNPSGYCVGPGGGGGTGTILSNLPSLASIITSLLPGGAGTMIGGSASCINTSYGAFAGQTNTVGAMGNKALNYTPSSTGNLTLSISSTNSVLCSGNSATLTATGGTSYTWFPGASQASSLFINPSSNSIFTVSAISAQGCTNSVTYTQVVSPTPTVLVSSTSPSICPLQSATLSATGASNYTWQPSASVSSSIVVTPSTSTSYSILGASSTCTAATVFNQGVYPIPLMSISPNTLSVCQGSVFSLTASGLQTYTWQPGGTVGAVLSTSLNASTIYTCIGTSANTCTASATSTVSVKPIPVFSFNTFSITCASLGSVTINASGGVGPFSYTWTPTALTGSAVTGLFPASYSVLVSDNGSTCSYIRTTTFTPLVPLSGTVVASSSVACNGANTATAGITLAAGSGTQTYQWQSASGVQTGSIATGLAAGIHTVIVSDALTFCTVTKTFVITQPPALSLNISPPSASVCLGGSLNFTGSASGGSGGYSYSWSSGVPTTTISITQTSSGTYLYLLNAIDSQSCLITGTATANFVQNPTVTVSSSTVCPLQFTSLLASGASTYSWSNGFSGNPLVISTAYSTSYSLTGTALGCTASATASISVKSAPSVTLSSNAPICETDSVFLVASVAPQYLWSGPSNFTSTSANPRFVANSFSLSGNYNLTVTAVNGCTAGASTYVLVNADPIVSAAAGTVCAGSPLSLSANFVSNTSYTWSGNAGQFLGRNIIIPASNSSMTGSYTLFAQTLAGCTASTTAQASVVSQPTLIWTGDSAVCAGKSINMQASGASTYMWYGPTNFYTVSTTAVVSNVSAQNAGTYSLVGTYGPCSILAQKQITVFPIPIVNALSNSPICEGASLQLTCNASGSAVWTGPASFQAIGTSVSTLAALSSAGVYTVNLTDVHQCQSSQQVTVAILPAPVLVASNATACLGSPANLQVQGALTYTWFGPNNFTATSSQVFVPIVSAQNAGVYTVQALGSNACVSTKQVTLSMSTDPLPVIQMTVPTNVCLNTNLKLQTQGINQSFIWLGPQNFQSTLATTYVMMNDSLAAGIYTLIVRNENNCVNTATAQVKVWKLPMASLLATKQEVCVPACQQFTLVPGLKQGPLKDIRYSLNSEPVAGSNLCFKKEGIYLVNAQYADTIGCINTSTLVIIAHEKPRAEFMTSPQEPIASVDETRFYDYSTGKNLSSYAWYIGDKITDTLLQKNITHRFNEAGVFPVVLVVSNGWNCADTVIHPITVYEAYNFYIPNSFSPNGDGLNDVFLPKAEGIVNYSMEIFDRWGQIIFRTNDVSVGWDGTYQQKPCSNDTYVWKINFKIRGGISKNLTGSVSVIR